MGAQYRHVCDLIGLTAHCMSPVLLRGCATVLLVSMALAVAAGLAAWGPLTVSPQDHHYAAARGWASAAGVLQALACAPMAVAAVFGLRLMRRSAWPASVARPWQAFMILAGSLSAGSALYHLQPNDAAYVLVHTVGAGAFVSLLLGFLAERVDSRCGSARSLAVGLAVGACAGGYWAIGEWSHGCGDLRAVLFLQGLPVLLIPAGALSLPGKITTTSDWMWMLGLYVVARAAAVFDESVLAAVGWITGHSLMHLLLTGIVLRLAYRAARSPATDTTSASAHLRTSLKTSA